MAAKTLTTNASAILKRMQARRGAVIRELSAEARSLGVLLNGECKRVLQAEIYNIPIPLTKKADETLPASSPLRRQTTKGHERKVRGVRTRTSQWSRGNTLKQGETWTTEGPTIVLRNNAKHARARNALGAPNPPNKAGRRAGVQRAQPGVPDAQKSKTRSVQWHQVVIVKHRDTILRRRREAVLRALVAPGGR